MIFIDNEGITNPKLNLALEEYALRNFSNNSDYLLFYINEPSIIIGRNQCTLEEINLDYVEEKTFISFAEFLVVALSITTSGI